MTKRKSRDSRILVTGFRRSEFEYEFLTEDDWLNIQQKFGKGFRIPTALREQLSAITVIYAETIYSSFTVRSLTSVLGDIEQWRGRTRTLRQSIWTPQKTSHVPPTKLTKLIDRYFHAGRGMHDAMFPLAHLARFLDGADALGQYFIKTLKVIESSNSKTTEMWLIWAAMVISFCRARNVPVMNPLRSNELHSGFANLLSRLQETLVIPELIDEKARKGKHKSAVPKPPLKKEGSSLREAALRAVKIAEGNPAEELLMLLANWGVGWMQFEHVFQNGPFKVATVRSRISKHKR